MSQQQQQHPQQQNPHHHQQPHHPLGAQQQKEVPCTIVHPTPSNSFGRDQHSPAPSSQNSFASSSSASASSTGTASGLLGAQQHYDDDEQQQKQQQQQQQEQLNGGGLINAAFATSSGSVIHQQATPPVVPPAPQQQQVQQQQQQHFHQHHHQQQQQQQYPQTVQSAPAQNIIVVQHPHYVIQQPHHHHHHHHHQQQAVVQQQQQQQQQQQHVAVPKPGPVGTNNPSGNALPAGFVVGSLLRDLAQRHVTLNGVSPDLPASHVLRSLTVFESSVAPGLDIAEYLHRLQHYLQAEDAVLVALLLLLRRYVKHARRPLTIYNVHRLVVAAMLVASKLYSDFFFCCQAVALVGGLPTKELARMEIHFLIAINWDGGIVGRFEAAQELVRAKSAFLVQNPSQMKATVAPEVVNYSKLFPDATMVRQDVLTFENDGNIPK